MMIDDVGNNVDGAIEMVEVRSKFGTGLPAKAERTSVFWRASLVLTIDLSYYRANPRCFGP
jgi:hypothetical protein